MLEQLFSYKTWNDVDLLLFNYFNCTLKKDFGELFHAGTTLPQISIDFEKGEMEFYSIDGPVAKFKLFLTAEVITV